MTKEQYEKLEKILEKFNESIRDLFATKYSKKKIREWTLKNLKSMPSIDEILNQLGEKKEIKPKPVKEKKEIKEPKKKEVPKNQLPNADIQKPG